MAGQGRLRWKIAAGAMVLVLSLALWWANRSRPMSLPPAPPAVQALRYAVGRLQGIVRLPASSIPAPLVLVIHGTHGVCRLGDGRDACPQHGVCPPGSTRVPSPEGLLYLAEALAQQGLAAVSIDAQEFGCDDSALAVRERADLLAAHIELWRQFAEGQGVLGLAVRGRVAIDRLVFVGHSTGGEAAALMPAELGGAVAAVVALAPTDATLADPGRVPLAVFVGGCDIDDHVWAGRTLFSRSLAHAEAPHALWFLGGADHAGALTTWPPDSAQAGFTTCDQPVAAADHRMLLAAAVSGWLNAVLAGRPPPQWLTGESPPPAELGWRGAEPPDWRVAYAGRGRRAPLLDPRAAGGAFLQACAGAGCSSEWGVKEPGLRVDWRQAGASVSWQVPQGAEGSVLVLRAVPSLATNRGDLPLRVRVTDSAGKSADVAVTLRKPWSGVHDAGFANYYRELPTTTRVPVGSLGLARPVTVALLPGTDDGTLMVADLAFEP